MKKFKKRATKVLAAALSAMMLAGAAFPGVQAAQAAPYSSDYLASVATQAAGDAVTGEELATLVNPVVQQYTLAETQGTWAMAADSRLAILANQANIENERLAEVVKLVNSEFADKAIVSSNPFTMVYANEEDVTPADVLVTVDTENPICEESDSEEAYRIDISEDGVKVTGASENAVMYALRTLQNYMVANEGLPYGTIIDYPDLAERRLFVDCGRKYFSKEWFFRQIREMSFLKLNTLEMHFSENLGFRIECKTDPSIVSDEYLTHEEVREIIEEARKYGVKVIPSFDSPGHVDQILKAHPEYGQISNTGDHYASGLDVTNREAVEYIYSLYDEYMELFEGCTDFHIGGDEYMEFDRAPFTTQYKSVLNDYAKETIGENAQWKDVLAKYINDLAEYVHSKGFTPRIFNDGIYYGENSWSEAPQIIEMHDYIGIDFWNNMQWNRDVAGLQTFIDKGHDVIYNFNSTFFYYVLRNDRDAPTDGRPQNSFDYIDQDRRIFEEWSPGKYANATVPDDSEFIAGAALGIWCDKPDLVTEDVVTDDIADELRSMATRTWNADSNATMDFEEFKEKYTVLGHAAGYEKGSQLPDAGEIQDAENLGKVTLRYVSDTGKVLQNDVVKYGAIGNDYTFEAEDIYGYKLISEGTVSGTFSEEGDTYTFTYTLDCDKSELAAELETPLDADDYIPATFTAYAQALATAQEVYDRADSEQTEVDEALAALQEAKGQAVLLTNYALYVETQYPLEDTGYQSGYSAYQQAVSAAEEVLYTQGDDAQAVAAALESIEEAKAGLMRPDGNTPTVTASKEYYSYYYYTNMLDGNPNTKCWFNGNQVAGESVVFTFPQAVNMSQVQVLQAADAGADILDGAEVQISDDGSAWQTVGSITPASQDDTFTFESTPVKAVRILITQSKDNWYQIAEVSFTYEQIAEDTALRDLIAEAEGLDITGKEPALVNAMIDALIEAQKLYAVNSQDTQAAQEALRAAMDALTETPPTPADKEALQNAVNQAAELVEEDYTPDTWAVLEAALAQANAVLADEEATQEAVDSALSALEAAVIGLEPAEEPEPEPGVDKSLLQTAYDYAVAQDTSKLLESLKVKYDAALANAEAILAKEDATTEEVWNAIDQLFEAVWSLDFTQGDKTLLGTLIETAEGMDADKYVADNWQQLVDALAEAKAVYEDGDAMDEDIQPVAQALLDAILAQRYKAEKSILEDLINQANAIDTSLYTAESVQAFTAALRSANLVLEDESLSVDEQATVDEAAAALRSAMDNLVETSAEDPKPSDDNKDDGNKDDNTKPGDTDKDDGKDTTNKDPNKGPMDGNKNPATGDSNALAALAVSGMALSAVVLAIVRQAKPGRKPRDSRQ